MRRKLENFQKLREALALNNLEKAATHGEALLLIQRDAEWKVHKTKDYEMWSDQFRRSAEDLVKAAKDKNLESAKLNYLGMTMRAFTATAMSATWEWRGWTLTCKIIDRAHMPVKTITADELQAKCRSGETLDVIDVRTPAEYQEMHAACARLVPLDQLDPENLMKVRNGAGGQPLYVICRSGNRAKQACDRLVAAGLENAVLVEGGTLAWEQAGGEVVRGPKPISLERQVRIAAGALVMLGSLLGIVIEEWFSLLAAVVGAGLIFAGITDTCGMAMLLARMPWNRRKNGSRHCSAR